MKSEKNRQKEINHIAFIMDGNGRWARKRLLPRNSGHKEGLKAMMRIADACRNRGLPYVSFYAFSTENKFRSQSEVSGLISLMSKIEEVADELVKRNVRLNIMGDISYFDENLRKVISDSVEKTNSLTGGVVNIGLNYGGRDELLRAAQLYRLDGGKKPLSDYLYTAGQPDPDILIRTGGEKRLSNFMLYQLAYTELFFTDTYWPDFSEEELNAIIEEYYKRDRRFGK